MILGGIRAKTISVMATVATRSKSLDLSWPTVRFPGLDSYVINWCNGTAEMTLCYNSGMKDFAVLIRKEGSTYVSFCPATLVSSYGETEEGAIEHHKEAMELFLEDMSEAEIQEITALMSPMNISSVQISLAR